MRKVLPRVWLAAIAWAGTAAMAQDVDKDLEEVMVTATRRPTLPMRTPVSMTVLGSNTLAAVNVDSFGDFATLVPGLTATDLGPGQKRYALRGLQSAGEPEVSLYYDEIPISGLPGPSLDTGDSQPDLKLWDVDRVEVLRGPQGTLYGNGSIGGAIRIISRRPVLDRTEAAVEASGASTTHGSPSWRLNGMFNQPLIDDRFALRLAAYYRDEGGWLDNHHLAGTTLRQVEGEDINWEHTWGARLSALLQATDHWSVTAIAYYQNLETGNSFETFPGFATPRDRYVSQAYVRTPWVDESWMFNLISTSDLGWADFVVTGAFQKRDATVNVDSTRFLLSLSGCTEFDWNAGCTGPDNVPADSSARQGVRAYSAEMRLVSHSGERSEWTVGAFTQQSDTYRRGQLAVTNEYGHIDYDDDGQAINRLFARNNDDSFDQYAVFLDAGYRILPKWKFSVGARWFHSYRSDQQVLVQQFFPDAPVGAQPFQDFSESQLFKKFHLAYEASEQSLFYVEAAQGFRAGGPNYPGGFALTAPPYEADSAWNYELGWKLALFDQRFDWTGAIYRVEWANVQQLLPVAIFSSIVNGGDARSDGFETEFGVQLPGNTSVNLGVAYADARLHGPQPVVTNPALQLQDGDRLAGVPRWTVNGAIQWTHAVAANLSAHARLDYQYASDRHNIVSSRNPSYFVIPASDMTSLHLDLETRDGRSIGLHVTNLFDEFVPQAGKMIEGYQARTLTAARPRTISLVLSAKF
ncbi:MAG: TonB-dependent receptor [Steroidobacteraceae bacterium]|nr:TonB-dependent receptor [Steroidobacteraceae bacterium]